MNKLLAYKLTGPGIQTTTATATTDFEKIISAILGVLTIIAVIYFVIQIILSGFKLISSKGDPKEFQAAQTKLIHNLIGLLIVVVAFGATAFLTQLLGINSIFDVNKSINSLKIN